jgi:hypothetical protein
MTPRHEVSEIAREAAIDAGYHAARLLASQHTLYTLAVEGTGKTIIEPADESLRALGIDPASRLGTLHHIGVMNFLSEVHTTMAALEGAAI